MLLAKQGNSSTISIPYFEMTSADGLGSGIVASATGLTVSSPFGGSDQVTNRAKTNPSSNKLELSPSLGSAETTSEKRMVDRDDQSSIRGGGMDLGEDGLEKRFDRLDETFAELNLV